MEFAVERIVLGIELVLVTTLKGIIDFLVAVFTGDWQGAWDAIRDIFQGFI